ncbi:MAG: hypothetical protein ACLP8S_07475 [Solirubrobacteraceae bacterium]
MSFEYPALLSYAGTDPRAPNPVLGRLIRNLTLGQSPVLRVGGASIDRIWWPIAGKSRPPGVMYVLSRRWLAEAKALVRWVDAWLILGVNLKANDPRPRRSRGPGAGLADRAALHPDHRDR